jgi:hypothetical protein
VDRIDKGTFGACAEDGEPIELNVYLAAAARRGSFQPGRGKWQV